MGFCFFSYLFTHFFDISMDLWAHGYLFYTLTYNPISLFISLLKLFLLCSSWAPTGWLLLTMICPRRLAWGALPHFLSGTTSHSRFVLYIPARSLETTISPKKALAPFITEWYENQELGSPCAHCSWGIFASRLHTGRIFVGSVHWWILSTPGSVTKQVLSSICWIHSRVDTFQDHSIKSVVLLLWFYRWSKGVGEAEKLAEVVQVGNDEVRIQILCASTGVFLPTSCLTILFVQCDNLKIFQEQDNSSAFWNVALYRDENSLDDGEKQTRIQSRLHPLGQVDLALRCLSFLNCTRGLKTKGTNTDELLEQARHVVSVLVSYHCWSNHHKCDSF